MVSLSIGFSDWNADRKRQHLQLVLTSGLSVCVCVSACVRACVLCDYWMLLILLLCISINMHRISLRRLSKEKKKANPSVFQISLKMQLFMSSSFLHRKTQQSIHLFILFSYILTTHLIFHVNIDAAVNLSSDNTEKKLSWFMKSPQLLIRAQNPMWERACDICQSHKVDTVCHCFLMKKKIRAELHIWNNSILCPLAFHGEVHQLK